MPTDSGIISYHCKLLNIYITRITATTDLCTNKNNNNNHSFKYNITLNTDYYYNNFY